MLKIKTYYVNPLRVCCYLIWSEDGTAAVIDPGFAGAREFGRLLATVQQESLKVDKVLLTHAHFDHVWGLPLVEERFGLVPHLHPLDADVLAGARAMASHFGLDIVQPSERYIAIGDGDRIRIGEDELEVIHTPGHTPGGVCFLDSAQKVLFSGDTLFEESVGRTDHEGGNMVALIDSINDRLMPLDDATLVLPGHGYSTTIGYERKMNPFI